MTKRKRRTRRSGSSYNRPKAHELDIVIPVYGRPDLLAECLKSVEIAGLDVDYQLYLIDDKSPEPMDAVYGSLNGRAKLAYNAQNMGFPITANRGAAMGHSPAILFLNTDVTLEPGSIRTMLNSLWNNTVNGPITPSPEAKTGVVGPKLLFPPDSPHVPYEARGKVQHAGLAINVYGEPYHVQIGWSRENPRLNEARTMQAVTGACMMTRREVWEQVTQVYKSTGDPTEGGFNEVYGLGTFEDVEYCFAARGNGYSVLYEPKAEGWHHVGASVVKRERAEGGYPLGRNYNIFMARCGHLLFWDSWLFG